MIDGIAASSSIAVPSGRLSQVGESSVRKSAMPKLAGTPIASAMKEVRRRPEDRHQRAELLLDRVPSSLHRKATP
jgi:hypothetical protein